MGRVAVEAFALGLPVFASDAGSIPDLVAAPELGNLFSWRDPEGLPDKLLDFVQGLPALRHHTPQRIRKAESYSVEGMVQKLVDCYLELLLDRGKARLPSGNRTHH
jgi:glycosyltransferase involved in cell wall biosynthesis